MTDKYVKYAGISRTMVKGVETNRFHVTNSESAPIFIKLLDEDNGYQNVFIEYWRVPPLTTKVQAAKLILDKPIDEPIRKVLLDYVKNHSADEAERLKEDGISKLKNL